MNGINVLLTLKCSLNCDYCFAQSLRADSGCRTLTFAELAEILSALDPDRDVIRLMGGEPTLHPQYGRMLQELKHRGFRVVVFTNGLQSILRQTTPVPDEILLNLNAWETYSPSQRAAIEANLEALGSRTGLAYTITQPAFDLSQHADLIRRYQLRPVIRLGLAQPVVGGHNHFLPDADLPAAHRAVARWAVRLAQDRIRANLDCGFMRCHFSEDQIEALVRAGTILNFHCAPTVDVGPGLRVWRCFAFSAGKGISREAWLQSNRDEAAFGERVPTIKEDCHSCLHRRSGWCQGGCLARKVVREAGQFPGIKSELTRQNTGVETV